MKTFIVKVELSNVMLLTIEGNVPVKRVLDLIPSGSNLLYGSNQNTANCRLGKYIQRISVIREEENKECEYTCELNHGYIFADAIGPLADEFGEWFHSLKLDYTIIEMLPNRFTMNIHKN